MRAFGCTSPPWVPKHLTTCVPSFSFCLSFFRRQINGRCGGSAEVCPPRPGHPAKPAAGRRPLLAHRSPTAPPARSWAVDGGQRGSLTPTALSPPATSDLGHGANPTRGQTGVHTHVTPFEPVNHILISSSRRSSSDCQKRWLYLRGWRSQQTALQVGPVQQAALWVGLYNKQPCNSGLCD